MTENKDPKKEEAFRRRQSIVEDHAEHPHPRLDEKGLRAHLLIHEMVEQQIEAGQPAEVLDALRRLTGGGMNRHQAVHAIGALVAKEAFAMMQTKRPLDESSYQQALNELTVEAARKLVDRI